MNKDFSGHLAALLTIFIWGTTFISTKILLTDFKPIEILFFRFSDRFIYFNFDLSQKTKKNDEEARVDICSNGTLWSYFVLFIRKYCTNIFDGFKYRSDNLNCTVFYGNLITLYFERRDIESKFYNWFYGCNGGDYAY